MADAQKNLKLWYNGRDITDKVDILECVVRDVSGTESDGLNLLCEHAEQWLKWGVEKNDIVRVTRGGYDSKDLYINSIAPENGTFRIYATGIKCAPFEPEWKSWENTTLGKIMNECAAEGGMKYSLFGISKDTPYEYLLRDGLRAPAFLEKLLRMEGCVLKSLNGSFTGIGISYAQGLACAHVMKVEPDMKDTEYVLRQDQMWSSVTINSAFGKGQAIDSRGMGRAKTFTCIPAGSNVEAKRWARGILLNHNRQNEMLKVNMDFDPGYTAMARIDVESKTPAEGHWLVDWVEHDLMLGKTRAQLVRCVTSII